MKFVKCVVPSFQTSLQIFLSSTFINYWEIYIKISHYCGRFNNSTCSSVSFRFIHFFLMVEQVFKNESLYFLLTLNTKTKISFFMIVFTKSVSYLQIYLFYSRDWTYWNVLKSKYVGLFFPKRKTIRNLLLRKKKKEIYYQGIMHTHPSSQWWLTQKGWLKLELICILTK